MNTFKKKYQSCYEDVFNPEDIGDQYEIIHDFTHKNNEYQQGRVFEIHQKIIQKCDVLIEAFYNYQPRSVHCIPADMFYENVSWVEREECKDAGKSFVMKRDIKGYPAGCSYYMDIKAGTVCTVYDRCYGECLENYLIVKCKVADNYGYYLAMSSDFYRYSESWEGADDKQSKSKDTSKHFHTVKNYIIIVGDTFTVTNARFAVHDRQDKQSPYYTLPCDRIIKVTAINNDWIQVESKFFRSGMHAGWTTREHIYKYSVLSGMEKTVKVSNVDINKLESNNILSDCTMTKVSYDKIQESSFVPFDYDQFENLLDGSELLDGSIARGSYITTGEMHVKNIFGGKAVIPKGTILTYGGRINRNRGRITYSIHASLAGVSYNLFEVDPVEFHKNTESIGMKCEVTKKVKYLISGAIYTLRSNICLYAQVANGERVYNGNAVAGTKVKMYYITGIRDKWISVEVDGSKYHTEQSEFKKAVL